MVDPVCVDEYTDVARVTGVKEIERRTESHALNLRGTAMAHCKKMGIDYRKAKLVVAHIDGGITIAAHDCGKQVDCNQGAGGEGPFTATRTGSSGISGASTMSSSPRATASVPSRSRASSHSTLPCSKSQ